MTVLRKAWEVVWARGIGLVLAYILIAPIKIYQWTISPMLGDVCRYYPSCSKYAVGALKVHGPVKGLLLTAYRLVRCTPFSKGGVDPVPERGYWQPSIFPNGQPRVDHR
jgi:putative membrane protein insertion efficiency factor